MKRLFATLVLCALVASAAETRKTLAECQSLLADNVSGSISPRDLRDCVVATNMAHPVNAQTGTTYTVLESDRGKLVTLSNASPVAVTLPTFADGWWAYVRNVGAGAATITPSGTIDGGASAVLGQDESLAIYCDGSNYSTVGGGSGTEEETHASEHQDGGADEVATATPGASAIPKAEADGDFNSGWIGQDQDYTWTGTHDFSGAASMPLPAAVVDAITEIAAGIRAGADAKLLTGTAGTSGNCGEWNADGDLIDSGGVCGGGDSHASRSGKAGYVLQANDAEDDDGWAQLVAGLSGALQVTITAGELELEIVSAVLPTKAAANTFAGVNTFDQRQVWKDLGAKPTTPASGYGAVYVNGDDLCFVDDSGTETCGLGGGSTVDYHYYATCSNVAAPGAEPLINGWSVAPSQATATGRSLDGTGNSWCAILFSDDQDHEAIFQTVLPPNYSSLTVQQYWHTATGSGNVVWDLDGECVGAGEDPEPTIDVFTETQTIASASGDSQITEWTGSNLDMTGCAAGEKFLLKFRRQADDSDVTDTYGNSALLEGIRLDITTTP